jgi:S1-C subfamily serine protease
MCAIHDRAIVMDMATSTLFSELSSATAASVSAVADRIVQIHGRPRRPASGIVVGPDRVVTTNHSVEWEDERLIVRAADGRKLHAEVAGRDPRLDVVLLRVAGLVASPIVFSTAPTPTGTLALIVGRTWAGRVQARLSVITDIAGPVRSWGGAPFDRLLSLDVGPYAGFSGSAVVLADGGLAGIATAGIFRGHGLGVPAPALQQSLDAIEKHGGIKRGYLGVTSQPVRLPARQRGEGSRDRGLLVLGVAPDSPADAAGLLVGDVLVGFDGHEVDDPETLLGLLTADRVGREVPLAVVRGGAPQQVKVAVRERTSGE